MRDPRGGLRIESAAGSLAAAKGERLGGRERAGRRCGGSGLINLRRRRGWPMIRAGMGTFVSELKFVVVVLVGFALAGAWAVLPFGRRLRYGVLAAPLAGLLGVVLGTAWLYSIVARPLAWCAIVSAGGCILFSVIVFAAAGLRAAGLRWFWPLAPSSCRWARSSFLPWTRRRSGWAVRRCSSRTAPITWDTRSSATGWPTTRCHRFPSLRRRSRNRRGRSSLSGWTRASAASTSWPSFNRCADIGGVLL